MTNNAEEQLIAWLINYPKKIHDAISIIEPHMFKESKLQMIYIEMQNFAFEGRNYDLVSLTTALKSKGLQIDSFVVSLTISSSLAMPEIETYALLVREDYIRRNFKSITELASAKHTSEDIFEVVDSTITQLEKITEPPSAMVERSKEVVIQEGLQLIIDASKDRSSLVGCPTGLEILDRHTRGFRKAHLIIVAARPGMGKTNFVIGGLKAAIEVGLQPAFFSLEMPAPEIYGRLLCVDTLFTSNDVRMGVNDAGKLSAIEMYFQKMKDWPLIIKDQNMTIEEIESYCIGQVLRGVQIDVIYIDYLQLMDSRHKYGSMEEKVGEMAKRCKKLAKRLHVPVILLSQLSRQVESRTNKRPMLSDLRQSGQIEEAADMALLLYRPSYYDPEDEGYDEVDVAKYRGGSTEVLVAKMDVLHNCWRNADRTEYLQPQQRIEASQEDLPF